MFEICQMDLLRLWIDLCKWNSYIIVRCSFLLYFIVQPQILHYFSNSAVYKATYSDKPVLISSHKFKCPAVMSRKSLLPSLNTHTFCTLGKSVSIPFTFYFLLSLQNRYTRTKLFTYSTFKTPFCLQFSLVSHANSACLLGIRPWAVTYYSCFLSESHNVFVKRPHGQSIQTHPSAELLSLREAQCLKGI